MSVVFQNNLIKGGIVTALLWWVFNATALRETIAKPGLRWLHGHPTSFYASFFLVTSQISAMFDPLRQLGRLAFEVAKTALKL